jgi:electron transfer flavoprotein beta subunit
MKVLVPIKRVPDPYAKVKPLADGSGLDLSGIKFDINPFDEIAVEEAVRMKERDANVTIVAVSIGGAETEEQLRKALAMGADEAILVETTDTLDPRVISAELAALVSDLQPDVVLMGKQATDEDNNQVGQRLAAKLGWPQATFASKVTPAESSVTVERETDDGGETLLLKTPCIITADLRLNEPRYIALPGIIKARSKPLSKRERATNLEPQVKTLSMEAPPARSGGRKVGSVDELVDALKGMGVIA